MKNYDQKLFKISDGQAKIFANNIYQNIANYIKDNCVSFIGWLLEEKSKGIILTNEGIEYIKENEREYRYEICNYWR